MAIQSSWNAVETVALWNLDRTWSAYCCPSGAFGDDGVATVMRLWTDWWQPAVHHQHPFLRATAF